MDVSNIARCYGFHGHLSIKSHVLIHRLTLHICPPFKTLAAASLSLSYPFLSFLGNTVTPSLPKPSTWALGPKNLLTVTFYKCFSLCILWGYSVALDIISDFFLLETLFPWFEWLILFSLFWLLFRLFLLCVPPTAYVFWGSFLHWSSLIKYIPSAILLL